MSPLTRALAAIVARPVSTLIGALTLVLLGAFALLRLPVSLLPAVERPTLQITAAAEALSREELLDRVTRPLERQLASLAGVTAVRTWTGDGAVRARVESEWQTDADRLRIEVERRLGALAGPEVVFTVETAAGDASPVLEVAVLGGASAASRTVFAREVLLPELARLEGAGRLETVGFTPLRAVVEPRAAALAARGLTAEDLVSRLGPVGQARPAGLTRAGARLQPLLLREEVRSLADLAAVRIPGPAGDSPLGDVAGARLAAVEDGSAFRLDGEEGVLVRVFRAPEANAVALARQVRERVAALGGDDTGAVTGEAGGRRPLPRASAGEGRGGGDAFRLRLVADRSAAVAGALRELGAAALLGLLLGTLTLRAFLGSWRPTLALAVVVPASALATFAVFQLRGVPLDLVSLGGLALATGLLVDSSIVVLEAIATARAAGEPRPEVAGTGQIALPVIASLATTAVVFLPFIYLQGLARAFFGVQAFAIVASLAAALLFSLTVTPVLSRLAGRKAAGGPGSHPGRGLYLRWLDRALARPALAGLLGLAVCAAALGAAVRLPRELIPDGPARELIVRYRLDPALAPEAAVRAGAALEDRLARALERAGLESLRWSAQPAEADREARANAAGTEEETGRVVFSFAGAAPAARALPLLRTALARSAGAEAWIEPGSHTFAESIERSGDRFEAVVTAATPERARRLAGEAAERLRAAGLRELPGDRRDLPRPALLLSWDAARLAGLEGGAGGRDRLESQVRAGLSDRLAGRVRIPGVEPEILVRATSPAEPGLLPVTVPAGLAGSAGAGSPSRTVPPTIPLGALAGLAASARPAVLERQDGQPAVRLAFQGDADRAEAALAGLATDPVAEKIAPAGPALERARAFAQLRLALGLSLLLVLLTLAALYESFTTPLAVMSTVPVALGGGLALLAAAGQSLNVLSFLGLILLVGIGVNNAVVLVHRAEQHAGRGEPLDTAIRRAAAERYRPIVMTTLTTLAGMLPLALLGGDGAELRRPLALAVLGGLATSLFATLLLVPVLYRALAGWRRSRRRSPVPADSYEAAA